jgi:hypothetical protein
MIPTSLFDSISLHPCLACNNPTNVYVTQCNLDSHNKKAYMLLSPDLIRILKFWLTSFQIPMAKTSPDPLWKLLFLIQALLPPLHQECNSFTYLPCISYHVQCLHASDICSLYDHAYNNIQRGRC